MMLSNHQIKYDAEELNPLILDYAWRLLESKAKSVLKSLSKGIIREIQKYGRETMSSGDDSGLTNLWDEFCVQIQYEKGWSFNMQEDQITQTCSSSLNKLKESNRQDYDLLVLYLSVSYTDSIWEEKDLILYGDNEISEFLLVEINAIAMEYSNVKITNYLDSH